MSKNAWGSDIPVEVDHGGTGLTTLTANSLIIGKGTADVEFLTLSKGDIAVGDGVTNPVALSPGDDCRKMLTVDSAEASGLKYAHDGTDLLEYSTISSVASYTTCTMDSTFKVYEIHLLNWLPATDGVYMRCQFTQAGGSLLTSSNYFTATKPILTSAANSESASHAILGGDNAGGLLSNVAAETYNSIIRVYNPSNTATKPIVMFEEVHWSDASDGEYNIGTCGYNSALAIESLTISMSSGNIASGTIQMYGVP